PGADAHLVAAARDGVVVSCVTAAVRLGLWVLDPGDRPHVAASPRSGGVKVGVDAASGRRHALIHWSQPIVPRHPDALVDPIENVLGLVAECLDHEQALTIWESALDRRLVTLPELRRLPYRGRARELCDVASPFHNSGLESFVPPRLAWLRLPIVPQVWLAGHRVDFLIGDRLVLQIDGGTHVGAQRDADIRHDALLMLLGYYVIRVGYDQVVNRWHEVQDLIMRAVAQGLHLVR
ncbi:endonuclease domain-containing protein, partial [Microbacterium sp.]|uniref:endonuclease domain-containing protein n=1 Tax=Microbacterium sp. TaxID=51671 RepID=UPI003C73AAE2